MEAAANSKLKAESQICSEVYYHYFKLNFNTHGGG